MTLSQKIKITDPMGLHLRAAAQLARLIQKYHSHIYVQKGLELVNAKSVLCLLQLGAAFGMELNFVLDGDDASQALEAILKLLEKRSL